LNTIVLDKGQKSSAEFKSVSLACIAEPVPYI